MVFGGVEKEHNRTADWLEGLKGEKDYDQQEVLEISEVMVKKQCKKIQNWKAPGWDGVQRFWIKRLDMMNGRIASQLNEILNRTARLLMAGQSYAKKILLIVLQSIILDRYPAYI